MTIKFLLSMLMYVGVCVCYLYIAEWINPYLTAKITYQDMLLGMFGIAYFNNVLDKRFPARK